LAETQPFGWEHGENPAQGHTGGSAGRGKLGENAELQKNFRILHMTTALRKEGFLHWFPHLTQLHAVC